MRKASFISILIVFACLFIMRTSNCVIASEPPKEAILRIETGMHMAMIKQIAIDESGQLLVTASDDKTVRIWELPSGRLARIIRPPIGEGNEGKLFSVAINPDGKTVACGGWTELGSDSGFTIYIFDTNTGHLIRKLTGLPNVVLQLAFSKDGSMLAATLGRGGLRVFRIENGQEIAADMNYDKESYSVDFDIQGRLVTACLDGHVRLYDQTFHLITKKKAPGGKQPYAARFSLNGERIAVGFMDSTRIALLSGHDLSFLAAPNTNGVDNGILGNVIWSADGNFLYAGGGYVKQHEGQRQRPIRRWSKSGLGSWQDFYVGATDTITDLVSLPDGSIVFSSADPAFGRISVSGQVSLFIGPSIADYRGNWDNFLVSPDGGTVKFSYAFWGKYPARFTISNRVIETDFEDAVSLTPPRTTAPGLNITDWKFKNNPKLNGHPLKLNPGEPSYSLAISNNGEDFLLGAQWYLRAYNRSGNERWNIPIPGAAWEVNLSRNGEVAVAALGDGTIRWYRMTDGKELLAFFPHNDRKRWVLWTPGGYYDASPGGEELIGWHMNQGKDQAATFFPASRFRSTYYRPDMVAKVLETRDEKEALRLADEEAGRKRQEVAIQTMLPPVVTILFPADGSTISRQEVMVSYSLRSPSGEPVTAIRVLVDGRPVSIQRGIAVKLKGELTQELQVTVPERNAEISLVAENRYASSVPSTIRLRWQGQKEFVIKPKLYVLAVGVSQYKDSDLKLGFAAKDAEDFAKSMERQKGGLYRDAVVKVLMDQKATKDDILDGLDWIQRETTSKDVAMVFLAGHGVNDQAGIYYYLPVNANTQKLKRTGVSFSDIKNTVASLAGKAILFVDTCHSGNVMGTRRGVVDINAMVNELANAENGVIVFASSTGKQYSMEDKVWGNGAFTKALVEGVNGKADIHNTGRITINMLDLYLSERVKELTKGTQTPTTTKPQTISDFPVAMKR